MKTLVFLLGLFGLPTIYGAGFSVTQDGMKLDGVQLYANEGALATLNCSAQEVDHSWSIPMTCLFEIRGLGFSQSTTGTTVGVEMELFFPSEFPVREYLFFYSSSLPHGAETPRVQNTAGLARGEWTTMVIWLPSFKSRSGFHADFGIGFQGWEGKYLKFVRKQMNLVESRELLEKERNFTLDQQHIYFNREEGIFIRRLALIHPESLSISEAEKVLTRIYPSYFDENWGRNLMALIMGSLGVVLALFWRSRVSVKLLLGFLIPLSGLLVFLGLKGGEYLSTLRNSMMTTLEQEMEKDFLKIQDLAKRSEQEFLSRVPRWISEIRSLINHKKMDKSGVPADIKSYQALKNEISRAFSSSEQSQALQKVAAMYMSAASELYSRGTREWGFHKQEVGRLLSLQDQVDSGGRFNLGILMHFLERANSLILYRESISDRFGASLTVTNGKAFYSHRPGRGLGRINYLVKATAQQFLDEISDQKNTDAPARRKKRLALISDFSEKIDFPLRSLDEYLSPSMYPIILGSGHRGGYEHRKFSTSFRDNRGQDWIVMAELEGHSTFLGFPEKVREYLQMRDSKLSSKNGGDFYLMGQRQGRGHGHGAIHYPDFPFQNQNRKELSLAAALAKSRAGRTYMVLRQSGLMQLVLSGVFPVLPSYSLALMRGLDSEFKTLQKRLNFYYMILILGLSSLVGISFLVSFWITRPLQLLQEGLERIKAGDLSQELWVPGRNEFRDLAWRFNNVLTSLRDKEEITRFLSETTAQSIVSGTQDCAREEVTVLFSGILETRQDETPSSQQNQAALQAFISLTQTLIFEHGGMVDKFTGNACLGIFRGESVHGRGLETCAELVKRLDAINHRCRKMSKKPLKIGMGLASGPVVLGHVGSEDRKDYTCIGNTVNMAARLENLGINFEQELTVFMDQKTHDLNSSDPRWSFQELEPVKIKGKREKQRVFELMSGEVHVLPS